MNKEILYCSNNQAKIWEVSDVLHEHGVVVLSPKEFNIGTEVEETGNTLEENAKLKVESYPEIKLIKLADDTAFEIDELDGEPGIFVRRWRGKDGYMTDMEIIDYCIERMKDLRGTKRKAQLRTVVALKTTDGSVNLYEGILRGRVVEKPIKLTIPGFPIGSLLYVNEWGKMLGDVHELPFKERVKYFTQRGKAINKAASKILEQFHQGNN